MEKISFNPIGIIHSPFSDTKGTPIQPSVAEKALGTVEVFPQFAEGLRDIEGFSHIILIFYFHLAKNPSLIVTPFMDTVNRGVFATRAPARPNGIGFSVVQLHRVEKNILHIGDIDIVNNTPLLDIKPCIPQFDFSKVTKTGWFEKSVHNLSGKKDDGRFTK